MKCKPIRPDIKAKIVGIATRRRGIVTMIDRLHRAIVDANKELAEACLEALYDGKVSLKELSNIVGMSNHNFRVLLNNAAGRDRIRAARRAYKDKELPK